MDGAIEALRREFAGLRTGRASTALLENISVEAYGAKMPMNQVASISVPEPRLLTVQVWDNSLVAAAERAIRESNLGLNPMTEGQVIQLPFDFPDTQAMGERRVNIQGLLGDAATLLRR